MFNIEYAGHRNSYTDLNKIYFWTITINGWNHLLTNKENKLIIINSLQWLVQNKLVEIYGYDVVMPNHIHLLWQQMEMNGKEFPKNSFEKFTAKQLVAKMKQENNNELKKYQVEASDRKHNIWLRDPLAVWIYSKEMAAQKLDYIHFNPLQPHWGLCDTPEKYRFSSAMFYANAMDEFNLVTHIITAL